MDYLIIELESLLLRRGKTSTDIIRATGHTPASISKIRNGKVKAIRLKTLLDICVELDCQPGDLIKRVNERELEELATRRARNALSRATATGDDPVLESDHVYVVDLRDDCAARENNGFHGLFIQRPAVACISRRVTGERESHFLCWMQGGCLPCVIYK